MNIDTGIIIAIITGFVTIFTSIFTGVIAKHEKKNKNILDLQKRINEKKQQIEFLKDEADEKFHMLTFRTADIIVHEKCKEDLIRLMEEADKTNSLLNDKKKELLKEIDIIYDSIS